MIEYIENIVYILCVICAIASALIAACPPKITKHIPDWVMIIINVLAVNVKNAKNLKTDIKGNPHNENIQPNSKNL